jgi:hypothetical protein
VAAGTIASTDAGGNGNITITADDVVFPDTGDDAIRAGTGIITIKQATAGVVVNLGTNVVGQLSLSAGELDLLFAGVVRIGDFTIGGNIQVTATLTPANFDQLELFSAGAVGMDGGDQLNIDRLEITATTG